MRVTSGARDYPIRRGFKERVFNLKMADRDLLHK
jgi:hypothetical protein